MATRSLTRLGLRDAVHRATGVSGDDAAGLVESVLGHISDALANGEAVKIKNFGSFKVRDKKARAGRNPKTGEDRLIEARRIILFHPARVVRNRVAARVVTGRRRGRGLRTGRRASLGLSLAAVALAPAPAGAASLKALVEAAAGSHHVGFHHLGGVVLIAVIGGIGLFFGLLL